MPPADLIISVKRLLSDGSIIQRAGDRGLRGRCGKGSAPMTAPTVLQVHVGDALRDTGARMIDAWHRAEQGNPVSEHHLSLPDLESLHKLLSPRRMQLLRCVHQAGGAASIAALARELGRDYRRVHGDVAALEYVGLLERDGTRLVAPYDQVAVRVHADMSLA